MFSSEAIKARRLLKTALESRPLPPGATQTPPPGRRLGSGPADAGDAEGRWAPNALSWGRPATQRHTAGRFARAWHSTFTVLGYAIVLLVLTHVAIGLLVFSDAPIKPSASGFVDKMGHVHTAQEYRAFQMWERSMTISFGAFGVFAVVGTIVHCRYARSMW